MAQDASRHAEAASSHALLRRVAERKAADAEAAQRYYAWLAAACALAAGATLAMLSMSRNQSSS
jgi:hypothetical protein